MDSDDKLLEFWESLQNPIQLDKTYLLYIESLKVGLKALVLEHFPHVKAHMYLFEVKMDDSIYWAAYRIYEDTEDFIDEDDPDSEEYVPINYRTRSVIEKEQREHLEYLLGVCPPENHDEIREMCAKSNEEDAPHEEFLFKCHAKAKEMLVQYFPEIPELSGNSIRKIDNMSHTEMWHWVQSFYEHSDFDTITRSSAEDALG